MVCACECEYGFIYFWLRWVFVAVWAFSSCSERGRLSSCSVLASHCCGFSCYGAPAQGVQASVDAAHGLSWSMACGIFLAQGLNLCPLHYKVDS